MKQVSKIVIGVFLITTITACSKDFLERPPLNQLSEATFWNTENDLILAVNAIYEQLPGLQIHVEGGSDNAHVQYPWESVYTDVSSGAITTAQNAGWGFGDKRRCNYFLENADNVTNIDPALLARLKAEVRFIRAYSYFRMTNLFGDVPLVLQTLDLEETDVPRTPKADVIDFIIRELGEISSALPVSYPGGRPNERGRITRGAALALKARVHLYAEQWSEAASTASEVMGLGYSLFTTATENDIDAQDDYSTWVDFNNAQDEERFRTGLRSYEGLFHQVNEGNDEVILDRQYIAQVSTQFSNTFLLPGDIGGWSSVTPTQALVDSYLDFWTGERITPVSREQRAAWYTSDNPAFFEEYRNRDPRFYASILFENAPWNAVVDGGYVFNWSPGTSNMSQTGYNFRKIVDPVAQRAQIDNHTNVPLIRYAEVLLTYAEARNELSGPDQSVYDAINAISARAGVPAVNPAVHGSQTAMRAVIRNERRIELALEGVRFDDIRRWRIAPDVMGTIYDIRNGVAQTRAWADRLYLMPVPQAQIDLSDNILTQNNGY